MAAEPGRIPAALMSSVMVPIVTFVVTVLDLEPVEPVSSPGR